MSQIFGLDGFDDLEREFRAYMEKCDQDTAAKIVGAAADEFVADVRKLPRPRSAIGGGHTHMLDSVGSQRDGRDWLVGWGNYYGKFVERGTRKMAAQPHLVPTWDKNKNKYLKTMTDKFLEVR